MTESFVRRFCAHSFVKNQPKPRTQTQTYPAARQEHRSGTQAVIQAPSADTDNAVVFEDDGETAYFYALDASRDENPILDALHIYDAEQVADSEEPFLVSVFWSGDSTKACLLINGQPHAVFDFATRTGYNDSGFPPPAENVWKHISDEKWRDNCRSFFE